MKKENMGKTAAVQPINNGWLLTTTEVGPPGTQPKAETNYYKEAAEATQLAAEFLEPTVLHLVAPPPGPPEQPEH